VLFPVPVGPITLRICSVGLLILEARETHAMMISLLGSARSSARGDLVATFPGRDGPGMLIGCRESGRGGERRGTEDSLGVAPGCRT